jgi:predicted nucleotidyltransferase
VDVLVEFDRPTGLFGLLRLQYRLEDLFGCPVDVGTPNSLKLSLRAQVLAERIDVA